MHHNLSVIFAYPCFVPGTDVMISGVDLKRATYDKDTVSGFEADTDKYMVMPMSTVSYISASVCNEVN